MTRARSPVCPHDSWTQRAFRPILPWLLPCPELSRSCSAMLSRIRSRTPVHGTAGNESHVPALSYGCLLAHGAQDVTMSAKQEYRQWMSCADVSRGECTARARTRTSRGYVTGKSSSIDGENRRQRQEKAHRYYGYDAVRAGLDHGDDERAHKRPTTAAHRRVSPAGVRRQDATEYF